MPKFTVYLQQYVEQVATMEVEAADEDQARMTALNRASEATWSEGDDAYKAEVYQVDDAEGGVVWER